MKNKNQKEFEFPYQEKSAIKCPNCGCELNLTIEDDKKTGKCPNCGYIEPSYDNWTNQEIHLD